MVENQIMYQLERKVDYTAEQMETFLNFEFYIFFNSATG